MAIAAAVVTVVAWLVADRPDEAVVRSVAVLVIACPHALGLAIPLVIAISTSLAARSGILVKDRLALERMRTVDMVLFDKTGTLTKGSHRVSDVIALDSDRGPPPAPGGGGRVRLGASFGPGNSEGGGRKERHSAGERVSVDDRGEESKPRSREDLWQSGDRRFWQSGSWHVPSDIEEAVTGWITSRCVGALRQSKTVR